ncbi:MAG: InlB B-repeat-containing protein, partial [Lachnospiraceae bacterium]|nr:InlB B-repeat-containing protein [Lachnospiraceae bacterium]
MNTAKKRNSVRLLTTLMFIALVSVFMFPMMTKAASTHTAHKGHMDHNGWTPISSYADLSELGASGGSGYLTCDIITGNEIWIHNGNVVNLCLNGYVLKMSLDYSKSAIAVFDGTLNLYDETGNSGRICHSDGSPGFGVILWRSDSNFNMYGGTITECPGGDEKGGAVCCEMGTFTMNGGIISDNTSDYSGAGVYIREGTFVMNDGKICNNKSSDSQYGGGVYVGGKGTFTMNGGTISENKAGYGGGVYNDKIFIMNGGNISGNSAENGGGVYSTNSTFGLNGVVYNAKFTMNAGNISGNSALHGGGVFARGNFEMNGGTISKNEGTSSAGGVESFKKFIMTDGTISENSAVDGGGIEISDGTLTITGGSISENSADAGGGIEISEGTLTITGGSISENKAGYGGGIFTLGELYLSGGTISQNTAQGFGGGIYVYPDGKLYMSGGTISENTADGYGGGLYALGYFNIEGGQIKDNKAFTRNLDWVNYSNGIYVSHAGFYSKGILSDTNEYATGFYDLTYESNNDSGNWIIQVMDSNCDNYVMENKFTRSGYTFLNWKDGGGTSYAEGAKLVNDNIRTLYAQWKPNKYTVKFDANGGSGTMTAQSIKYNTSTALKKNTFTRDGYDFAGWNTKADGSGTSYADATKVKLNVLNTNKVTLYAQWKAKYATVTFNVNGGTALKETTVKYQITKAYGKLPETSRTGYTFSGWYTAKSGGTKVTAKSICEGDITFYAHWKAKTDTPYKVEHYRQKVDGTYPATANETEALTGKTNASITPEVKTYKGFTAPETQTVKIKADGKLVVKYYYTRNSYKLTWNFAGGKASGTYTKGTVKYGAKITAPVPVRDGYAFTGWNKTVPAKMPAYDATFKAKWRKLSQEEQVRNFVSRFYTIILDRPAEAAGLAD